MTQKTRLNPVILKVHIPICIIGSLCLAELLRMAGYTSPLRFVGIFVFELIYLGFLDERIEQQETWITVQE